jgi:hypothetical protein
MFSSTDTMTGRRLLVRKRPEPKTGNVETHQLFARLSPQTARALSDYDAPHQFMPLCLRCEGLDEPIYVSYNGGNISEEGKIVWFQLKSPETRAPPLMNTVH